MNSSLSYFDTTDFGDANFAFANGITNVSMCRYGIEVSKFIVRKVSIADIVATGDIRVPRMTRRLCSMESRVRNITSSARSGGTFSPFGSCLSSFSRSDCIASNDFRNDQCAKSQR